MPVILAGVLNVTPDSFSDGGSYPTVDRAVEVGIRMVDQGAGWIDVGGESTRPGAETVSGDAECARVVPVIQELVRRLAGRARISVDTYKATTAEAALSAGATIVNDVSGGCLDPDILSVVANHGAGVVLGHMPGSPATMMERTHYDDVVGEVGAFLRGRVTAAKAVGCTEIWIDPGIGFGKQTADNLALLASIPLLRAMAGVPVMMGVSRKRFLGDLTGRPVHERLIPTAAAVAACVLRGADVVRVHDVAEMRDVVTVAEAVFERMPPLRKKH